MKYFEFAARSDTEAYFAQFTPDAVVEDEGTERHGISEIRAWRTEVPAVAYELQHVTTNGDVTDAAVQISGDFAGSPVVLNFHFEFAADDRIAVLRIRP